MLLLAIYRNQRDLRSALQKLEELLEPMTPLDARGAIAAQHPVDAAQALADGPSVDAAQELLGPMIPLDARCAIAAKPPVDAAKPVDDASNVDDGETLADARAAKPGVASVQDDHPEEQTYAMAFT